MPLLTLPILQTDIDLSTQKRRAYALHGIGVYDAERDDPISIALSRLSGLPREHVRAHPDYFRLGQLLDPDALFFDCTERAKAFMLRWDRYGKAEPTILRLPLSGAHRMNPGRLLYLSERLRRLNAAMANPSATRTQTYEETRIARLASGTQRSR